MCPEAVGEFEKRPVRHPGVKEDPGRPGIDIFCVIV